jgi:hypothetical protein
MDGVLCKLAELVAGALCAHAATKRARNRDKNRTLAMFSFMTLLMSQFTLKPPVAVEAENGPPSSSLAQDELGRGALFWHCFHYIFGGMRANAFVASPGMTERTDSSSSSTFQTYSNRMLTYCSAATTVARRSCSQPST